jgi:hypothetical protein
MVEFFKPSGSIEALELFNKFLNLQSWKE